MADGTFVAPWGEELSKTDVYSGRNGRVVKSNELIQQSIYNLSLVQQKIILYVISMLRPYQLELSEVSFSIREFCDVAGLTPTDGNIAGSIYRSIKDAIMDIRNRAIWLEKPDGSITTTSWVNKATIHKNSGTITIIIDEDLKEQLLNLTEYFTQYELLYVMNFKSKYTIRLYEYISSLLFDKRKTYTKRCTVEELRKRTGVDSGGTGARQKASTEGGQIYPQYRDFKRRVLAPAVIEINQYSDKVVAFEEVTQGRKVVAVMLTIREKTLEERLAATKRVYDRLDGQTSVFGESNNVTEGGNNE